MTHVVCVEMIMRDTSARLKKTKEAIVAALFALLENSNYEDITILEIAGGNK